MKLDIKIEPEQLERFKDSLQDRLEIAAVKGYERMVELLPARGETEYATGQLRQSIRFQKTGPLEYTFYAPMNYAAFVEFGTGPRGRATGAVPTFPNDPQPKLSYHSGEVLVTRWRGELLDVPFVRHTQGMEAQPYMRPGMIYALEEFVKLLK